MNIIMHVKMLVQRALATGSFFTWAEGLLSNDLQDSLIEDSSYMCKILHQINFEMAIGAELEQDFFLSHH
jgi:hypothetical protein